jgi:hypothetical protein
MAYAFALLGTSEWLGRSHTFQATPTCPAGPSLEQIVRTAPVANAGRRRPPRGRHGKPARRPARSSRAAADPILDDKDLDMTSIRTFVTCPFCANSLMLAPEAFLPEGATKVVPLRCNVCENRVKASLRNLECVNGETFPAAQFLVRAAAATEAAANDHAS